MPRPSRFRLLVLAALAALAVSSATFAAEPTRLPRENLLVYRAATGAPVPVRVWGPPREVRTAGALTGADAIGNQGTS